MIATSCGKGKHMALLGWYLTVGLLNFGVSATFLKKDVLAMREEVDMATTNHIYFWTTLAVVDIFLWPLFLLRALCSWIRR